MNNCETSTDWTPDRTQAGRDVELHTQPTVCGGDGTNRAPLLPRDNPVPWLLAVSVRCRPVVLPRRALTQLTRTDDALSGTGGAYCAVEVGPASGTRRDPPGTAGGRAVLLTAPQSSAAAQLLFVRASRSFPHVHPWPLRECSAVSLSHSLHTAPWGLAELCGEPGTGNGSSAINQTCLSPPVLTATIHPADPAGQAPLNTQLSLRNPGIAARREEPQTLNFTFQMLLQGRGERGCSDFRELENLLASRCSLPQLPTNGSSAWAGVPGCHVPWW